MPKYNYNTDEDVKDGKKKAKMEGLRSKGYSEVDAMKRVSKAYSSEQGSGMVSMKKDKKSSEDMPSTVPASPGDEESYPYGLQLRLENEELDKLGFNELPEIGKTCKIEAEGVVESVSSNQSKGDDGLRKSVTIQITKMASSKADDNSDGKPTEDN